MRTEIKRIVLIKFQELLLTQNYRGFCVMKSEVFRQLGLKEVSISELGLKRPRGSKGSYWFGRADITKSGVRKRLLLIAKALGKTY